MQETKLADADAPAEAFRRAGYELVHQGEGRWNGVAIASRLGVADVITNFTGKPIPSDHAPLLFDIDQPGCSFDAGWLATEGRIAACRAC